jgi:hypothetical protein
VDCGTYIQNNDYSTQECAGDPCTVAECCGERLQNITINSGSDLNEKFSESAWYWARSPEDSTHVYWSQQLHSQRHEHSSAMPIDEWQAWNNWSENLPQLGGQSSPKLMSDNPAEKTILFPTTLHPPSWTELSQLVWPGPLFAFDGATTTTIDGNQVPDNISCSLGTNRSFQKDGGGDLLNSDGTSINFDGVVSYKPSVQFPSAANLPISIEDIFSCEERCSSVTCVAGTRANASTGDWPMGDPVTAANLQSFCCEDIPAVQVITPPPIDPATSCVGTWSRCTNKCETANERIFNVTQAATGNGAACPVEGTPSWMANPSPASCTGTCDASIHDPVSCQFGDGECGNDREWHYSHRGWESCSRVCEFAGANPRDMKCVGETAMSMARQPSWVKSGQESGIIDDASFKVALQEANDNAPADKKIWDAGTVNDFCDAGFDTGAGSDTDRSGFPFPFWRLTPHYASGGATYCSWPRDPVGPTANINNERCRVLGGSVYGLPQSWSSARAGVTAGKLCLCEPAS